MAAELESRRERLRSLAKQEGLEGALVVSWRRRVLSWFAGYFPGFRTNFASLWLPADGDPLLGIRFGFDHERAETASGLEVIGIESPLHLLPGSVRRIGLVAGDFAIDERTQSLAEGLERRRIECRDLRSEVDTWRIRKSPNEIEGLKRATEIAAAAARTIDDAATEPYADFILASRVEAAARQLGAEECLCLVGFGPNGVVTEANGRVSDVSQSISIEITAVVDGFCTQICSTWPPSGRTRERAHDACLEAQGALSSAIRNGVPINAVVSAADAALDSFGLRSAKLYDFGHGIGCEVPELPRLNPGSDDVLQSGMVLVAHVGVRHDEDGAAFVGGPVLVGDEDSVDLGGKEVFNR